MLTDLPDAPDTWWLLLMHNAPAAAVLAVFVTVIAYIHKPRLKVLVFSFPVPFTCAYLATQRPIDATYFTGLLLTVSYHWCVYLLARKLRLVLGLAIMAGVVMYLLAAALFRLGAHWSVPVVAGVLFIGWLINLWRYRAINEPGHRSLAPPWVKLPTIFTIAMGIFGLTELLAGAVTTFPYAGVFTSYEMRHSLRTLAGQFTINVLGTLAMFMTMWWLQDYWAQPWPLLGGWCVTVPVVLMLHALGVGQPARVVDTPRH